MTPPPNARSVVDRSTPAARMRSSRRSSSAMLLVASPGGSTIRRLAIAAPARLASRVARCGVAATSSSVTRTTSGRAQHAAELGAGALEQARPDHDLVAARAEVDREPRRAGHDGAPACAARASSTCATTALIGPCAAVDHHVRHGIDRRPLLEQLGERRARIAAGEQRPLARPGGAPDEHVELGPQPDRARLLADQSTGLGIHERAAAERQNRALALQQTGDHLALLDAERRLADLGEDVRDGRAGGGLDRRIGVLERPAERPRQAASDRGLAGAHHADQHDRPVERRRGHGSGRGLRLPSSCELGVINRPDV